MVAVVILCFIHDWTKRRTLAVRFNNQKRGDIDMKTRERLLFMVLGGLLVLASMIVGQFVFSTAQAQAGAQDATFKTVIV